MADAALPPYILRLDSLAMDPLLAASARPNLAAWYDRVRARPNYQEAVANWLPDGVYEMFRGFGAEAWPDVEQVLPA